MRPPATRSREPIPTGRKPAVPGLPRPKEAAVLKAILATLSALGVRLVERQNTGCLRDRTGRPVRYGTPGTPDVRGLLDGGRLLCVEVKAPGRKPTAVQVDMMRRLNAAGAVAFWADEPATVAWVLRCVTEGATIEVEANGRQWVVWPG